MTTGLVHSDGSLTVVADGMRVVNDGLTVGAVGLNLDGGASLLGPVTVDGEVEIQSTGVAVADGLILGGDWMSRFSINNEHAAPEMVFDIQAQSDVISRLFMPSHDATDDLTLHSTYNGSTPLTFDIEVDYAGQEGDTFMWRTCQYFADSTHCDSSYTSSIPLSTDPVHLAFGLSVSFSSTTGHHRRDRWRIDVEPTNPVAASPSVGTESVFLGQDGSLSLAGNATVSGGMVVSASGVPYGDSVVTRTGLTSVGLMRVHSGGLRAIDSDVHLESGGLGLQNSSINVAGGFEISSSLGINRVSSAVIQHGQLDAESININDGLVILDTGLTVEDIGVMVSDGDIDVESGLVVSGGVTVYSGGLVSQPGAGQAMHVDSGGAQITDGLTVTEGGVNVALGGLVIPIHTSDNNFVSISGGLRVNSAVNITDGGMTVQSEATLALNLSGGLNVSGGLLSTSTQGPAVRVTAGGATFASGGLSILSDGMLVNGHVRASNGIHIQLGSLSILSGGATVSGLVEVSDGGAVLAGGLLVSGGGMNLGMFDSASSGLRLTTNEVSGTGLLVSGGLVSHHDVVIKSDGLLLPDTGFQSTSGNWIINGGPLTLNRGHRVPTSHMLDMQSLSDADNILSLRNTAAHAMFQNYRRRQPEKQYIH